ncbi:hypothetical protein ACYOEI_13355 [Singulisphaera rosea]
MSFALSILGLIAGSPAVEVWGAPPKPKELTIHPSPAPSAALGHRLLPLESELNPGDAAPIYLRLTGEVLPEKLRELGDKPKAWLDLPLETFPVAEARAFVNGWASRIEQVEFGARRQTCDWNYTLPEERDHSPEILLPDIQMMRTWARLLALKARVEIVEKKFDDAARTIETGIAFSRHLNNGPFLINSLVGMASAHVLLEVVAEFVAQPGAPNLYWSLTDLPRPLIPIRGALAHEYKLCEWLLPEMTDLDRERTPAEWASRVARLHARLLDIRARYKLEDVAKQGETLAAFREWVLPGAREYLKTRLGKLDGLNDDQMILLFYGRRFHELYDDNFKAATLPFPEAEFFHNQASRRLSEEKDGPLWVFSRLFPAVISGHRAEVVLDRKVAALRTIEALRLHAGVKGQLPNSLDEVDVKLAPVPPDPYSGKPFEYRLENLGATLIGPAPQDAFRLEYRLTLTK